YSTGNSALDQRIIDLVRANTTEAELPFVQELAMTALKLALDGASRVDLKIASAALKEMRHAFRIFTPFRHARKVTVFGSARTATNHSDHQRAVEFGRRMAEAGWMVITGAGSGIMGAAHIGAGRKSSFGVNIKLPFEQEANEIIRGDEKLMTFRYFFTRKLFLMKESHAVALFPGGFGTLDEGFEVLTLLQTGRQTPLPVVMVENPETGYFRDLHRFIEVQLLGARLLSEQDLSLYRVVQSARQASEEILRFYRVYHSSRYVGTKLLIRLERELDDGEIADLSRRFSDVIRSGGIERAKPLPEELGTSLYALARIELDFNRRDFGRLRQLIDAINAFGPR
ncbi:MAG: TIGR00730 family Rossman fold protein, partial [Vicinamibacteria bacterium]